MPDPYPLASLRAGRIMIHHEVSESTIPGKSSMVLIGNAGKVTPITGFTSLKGAVKIDSLADALQFLRVLTSPKGAECVSFRYGIEIRSVNDVDDPWLPVNMSLAPIRHAMRGGEMSGGLYGLYSSRKMQRLFGPILRVRKVKGGYEVRRPLMFRGFDRMTWVPGITTDVVGPNGEVRSQKIRFIEKAVEDRFHVLIEG